MSDYRKIFVRLLEQTRGRVTGWAVVCSEDGPMQVLAPNKRAAKMAAIAHINQIHAGAGRISA